MHNLSSLPISAFSYIVMFFMTVLPLIIFVLLIYLMVKAIQYLHLLIAKEKRIERDQTQNHDR